MSKERILKDATIKILSIVFAVLLWFYVITEQNPVVPKEITIPVRIMNLEALERNNLVMLENPNSYSITLKLKGKKEVLDSVNYNSFNAYADISNYTNIGENYVPVVISNIPNGVTITSKLEHSIKVTLDKKLVVQMPVTANITGNPAGGLASLDPILNPAEVVLSGAQSIINKIKTVRVDLDIAGVKGDVSKMVPVKLLDEKDQEVTGVQLSAKLINVTVPVANTKRVPIQLIVEGTAAEGYMIVNKYVKPSEILVTGKQDALDSVSVINTYVKINNPVEDVNMPVTLNLPEGIKLVNANETVNAVIDVEQVVTKSLNISTIEYRNLKDGYIVNDLPERTIKVTVRGPKNLVENAEEHIDLYIDMKDAQKGVNNYEIKWEASPMFEVLEVSPQNIALDIVSRE